MGGEFCEFGDTVAEREPGGITRNVNGLDISVFS
jgi:hypothetical protein